MDNQSSTNGSTEIQKKASTSVSMPNAERPTGEKKSYQIFQQSQPQVGVASQEPRPTSNSYAPPMQINVGGSNVSQNQSINNDQTNLSLTAQEPTQLEQQIRQQQHHGHHQQDQQHLQHQHQQQQQRQLPQLAQPQMPPQHPPIKPLLADESTITIPPQQSSVPSRTQALKQESLSPARAVITKVKLSDELNIFDWFRTKEIISQIAERAKSSVDSVITTLDPGMKEYLYSGGNINIIVISDNGVLISSIRDAFQSVFGRATVTGARYESSNAIVPTYPIRTACGLEEAVQVCQERIKKLRQDTNSVPQNQVVVVVQPALVSMNITYTEAAKSPADKHVESSTPKWFYTYYIVDSAKAVQLPADFPHKHLGFAGTIDELMAYKLRLNPNSGFSDEYGCFWLREWAGIYETQILHQLSLTLAQSYRRKWNDCAHLELVS